MLARSSDQHGAAQPRRDETNVESENGRVKDISKVPRTTAIWPLLGQKLRPVAQFLRWRWGQIFCSSQKIWAWKGCLDALFLTAVSNATVFAADVWRTMRKWNTFGPALCIKIAPSYPCQILACRPNCKCRPSNSDGT